MISERDLGYIRQLYTEKGYVEYTEPYKLNIFGVRNFNMKVNIFNEQVGVYYFLPFDGEVKVKLFPATTKPGLYWMRNLINPKGTAILVEGQYENAYKIALHNGKYQALCQRLEKVAVYRDRNRDDKHDPDPSTIEWGMFGINIHRASAAKVLFNIDSYSAGCQAIKHPAHFDELMNHAYQHLEIYGNKFTYTLLKEQDIFRIYLRTVHARG